MTKLFLSYARGDDEPFVRRLYGDLTARGFEVWFDRESMPSRNLTFHQEIRDAVAACDRLNPPWSEVYKMSRRRSISRPDEEKTSMNTIFPHKPSTGVTGYRKRVDALALAEAVDRLLEQIHGTLAPAGEFPAGSEAAPKTF